MEVGSTPQSTPVTPQMPVLSAAAGPVYHQQPLASVSAAPSPTSVATSPPAAPPSAALAVQSVLGARAQQPSDPTVFQLTDRQVRGGSTPDKVPLYAMCRLWVQNSIDANCGPRPGHPQEDNAARLPPPLPPSGEALKDPPKEVALLQDEETLFLDEDTLPAELLMEHHKEHWVAVRGWHQANIQRETKRWERRLGTLLPGLAGPTPPVPMPPVTQMAPTPAL